MLNAACDPLNIVAYATKLENDMRIERIHHVAYPCKNAKETVGFYTKMLNMDFVLAIAKD
jgi:hypothetical protein